MSDDTTTTESPREIRAKLALIRNTLQRRRLVSACVMTFGLAAVIIVLLDAANRFLPLRESWACICVALIAAAAVLLLAFRLLAVLVTAPTPVSLALTVERERPEFLDAFVCAVETEEVPPQKRRPLQMALLQAVYADTAQFDCSPVVVPDYLRWQRLSVPAFLFIAIAVLALRTQPLAKAGYCLRDWLGNGPPGLIVTPGNEEVPEHADVGINVEVKRWDNEAHIVYATPEGKSRFLMNKGDGRRHFFTFYDVTGTIRYRVLTPALASSWYTLRTYRPPALSRVEMRVDPPAYTGRDAAVYPRLSDCSAVVGSRISIEADVAPGVRVLLKRRDKMSPLTEVTPHKRVFTIQLAEELVFSLVALGTGGRSTETPVCRISAEPDLPPVIDVLRPRKDTQARVDGRIALEARASDDFGLSYVALSYAVSGGERREVPLFEPQPEDAAAQAASERTPAAAVLDRSVQHVLDLASVAVVEGDVVSYHFAASDNREPDPQHARSEVYFIEVRPEITPREMPAGAEQKEFDVSGVIAELKRLIRMTWDVLAAPDDERGELAAGLHRAMKDLRLETQRKANEIAAAASGGHPLAQLLRAAADDMGTAASLISRLLVEESLPPQERALAKLITVENELLKNAATAERGEGDGKDGGQEQQEREDDEEKSQSQKDKLTAMRETLEELRQLSTRQDDLNREMGRQMASPGADTPAKELSAAQGALENEARQAAAELERIAETREAGRQVETASGEMDKAERNLKSGDMRTGQRHGRRAHHSLAGAIQSLEDSYRQAAADEIERLAKRAQQLARAERQASDASEALAAAEQPDEAAVERAGEHQRELKQNVDRLTSDIGRAAAELDELYPDAAQAVVEAAQEARQQNLSGKMTRAGNALLYRRFDKASRHQADAANILQYLGVRLSDAARHLPTVSREELLEALAQLQRDQQEVEQIAEAGEADASERLEQVRERAWENLDPLAATMRDGMLQRVTNGLAAPLGNGGAGTESRRLQDLLRAARRVLERHLFAAEIERRVGLTRDASEPPEKYRRLVEKYFKDLSRIR